ncbi:hypothetical protein ACFQ2B_31325 [Streptomyces stramineus]
MRDVDLNGSGLDFRELGMKRFRDEVDRDVLSGRQSERVWRQLCMDDRAVVIADGLEETFADDDKQKERDILIRRAIQRAEQQKLPWSSPPARTRHWSTPGPRSSIWSPSAKRPRWSTWRRATPTWTATAWTGSSRRRPSPSRPCICRSPGSCASTTCWST